MDIILASKSPRRQELLKLITSDFSVEVSNIDETYDKSLQPSEIVMYLSYVKANIIHKKHDNALIIGSDTIVLLNQEILEKPIDAADAYKMLKNLSNKTHQVMTGVTLLSNNIKEQFYNCCDVTFYPLTDQEIYDYIKTNEPFDKAGAYGIQGYASKFIKEITGDYYTVVGLPVGTLYQKMKEYKLL